MGTRDPVSCSGSPSAFGCGYGRRRQNAVSRRCCPVFASKKRGWHPCTPQGVSTACSDGFGRMSRTARAEGDPQGKNEKGKQEKVSALIPRRDGHISPQCGLFRERRLALFPGGETAKSAFVSQNGGIPRFCGIPIGANTTIQEVLSQRWKKTSISIRCGCRTKCGRK